MKRSLITLAVLLIALSIINIREALSAPPTQVVDKSGLDIYCNAAGGEYHFVPQSNVSVCLLPDGTILACNITSGKCSKSEFATRNPNPSSKAIEDLVTLKFLQAIDIKLNNLASQVSTLATGQNTITSLVGDVQALCSLSDLVPLARPLATGGTQTIIREPGDVCQRDSEGRLIFRVHNQGGIDAPASSTRVFFGCPNATCTGPTQVDVATPALPGFSGVELVVPIPNSCFSTTTLKCDFTIGVDVAEAVTEANEANNTTAGVCGPSIL